MRILVIDTETTGTNLNTDEVIEVAGILIETDSRSVIASYSSLLHVGSNPAERVNGIPQAALDSPLSMNRCVAISPFIYLLENADVVVAHNTEFDRPMTLKLIEAELGGEIPDELKKPWVCSMTQLRFPAYPNEFPGRSRRRLAYVAVDHGIPVPKLHRAMSDAMLLTSILLEIPDLDSQIERAKWPRDLYAVYPPSPDPRPTEFGFHWNPDRKRWERLLNRLEAGELPFAADVVHG